MVSISTTKNKYYQQRNESDDGENGQDLHSGAKLETTTALGQGHGDKSR
jgi:hypothetical protein